MGLKMIRWCLYMLLMCHLFCSAVLSSDNNRKRRQAFDRQRNRLNSQLVCESVPLELGIVLDSSSSISDADFVKAKNFLQEFLDQFQIGDDSRSVRVSIITFGFGIYPDIAFNLTTYRSKYQVLRAIQTIPYQAGNYTDTGAAINYMHNVQLNRRVVRPNVRKVGLVITDGNSQKWMFTGETAEAARQDGIAMFAVGIGPFIEKDELLRIAGSDSRVFQVENFDRLTSITQVLGQQTCTERPVPIRTPPPLTTTAAPIEEWPDHVCLAECRRECQDSHTRVCDYETPIEFGLVLDSSSSITESDFRKGRRFLQEFLRQFHIGDGPNDVRVSIISFGKGIYPDIAFNLTTYRNKEEVIGAIGRIPHKAGLFTDTGLAIEYMNDVQLNRRVVRPNVRRISLVITDGNSQRWRLTRDAAREARRDGITMFALGIGQHISEEELLRIAGSETRVTMVENFEQLSSIKRILGRQTCRTSHLDGTHHRTNDFGDQFNEINTDTEKSVCLDRCRVKCTSIRPKPRPTIVCRDAPIELGIVLDSSQTMEGRVFEETKEFLQEFLQQFQIGTGSRDVRVSVITFGKGIYRDIAFNLTSYVSTDHVVKAIGEIPYIRGEYTDTGFGINYMHFVQLENKRVRPYAEKVGLVIADDNSEFFYITEEAAQAARNSGITMYAVGIGPRVTREELLKISGSESRMWMVEDSSQLENIKESLGRKTCRSRGRVDLPTTTTTTTPAPTTEPYCLVRCRQMCTEYRILCKGEPIELGIVLDSSSSIDERNFDTAKKFLQDFVSQFQIGVGPSDVRVAIITYGMGIYEDIAFNLTTYRTKADVLRAIGQIPHRIGLQTDTGMAISYMHQVQLGRREVRPNAERISLVITDGNSQRWYVTKSAAEAARYDGVKIFAVGIGYNIEMAELSRIAGDSDRVTIVENFQQLSSIKRTLGKQTCQGRSAESPNLPPWTGIANHIDFQELPYPDCVHYCGSTCLGKIVKIVCEHQPIEFGIVLDSSNSIDEANFEKAKQFLRDFLNQFQIGDGPRDVRVSIITYGEGIYKDIAFNLATHRTKAEVLQAISQIPHRAGQYTDTGMAINHMHYEHLDNSLVRPDADKIGIVITDGNSQLWYITRDAAQNARDDGITMFAIGIGQNVKTDELFNIAGDNSRVTLVENFDSLSNIKEDLADRACNRRPRPTAPPTTTTTLAPTTTIPSGQGIKGPECKRTCRRKCKPLRRRRVTVCDHEPTEFGIVLDSSISIKDPDFDKAKKFLQEFLNQYQIGSGHHDVRVSIITYGQGIYPDIAFNLTTYRTKADVLKAIGDIPHRAGPHTDTGLAIAYMHKVQLDGQNIRPHAGKIGLVITDGNSQNWRLTEEAARASRESGIIMFALGIGDSIKIEELLRIAGNQSRVTVVETFDQLSEIKEILGKKTCISKRLPVVRFPKKWLKGEKINYTGMTYRRCLATCRRLCFGIAPLEQRRKTVCEHYEPLEFGVVLDSSSSIENTDFETAKTFLQEFMSQFHVGSGQHDVRVSIITFGKGIYPEIAFNLTTYRTKDDVVRAIGRIPHKSGSRTDTGLAINYMHDVQLNKRIVRPDAGKIGLVITDGNSQDWHFTEETAKAALRDGIVMFAVGIGENIQREELLRIAGDITRVTMVDNFDQLSSIKEFLGKQTCIRL